MRTTVAIIGAGQAGLAMSRCLTHRSIDHVVLERGEVANSWRTERWDSLRLLTPNWMSRLPGHTYTGDDPDGYMTAGEVVGYLEAYRATFSPPIRTWAEVERVERSGRGYRLTTTAGGFESEVVVVATGACSDPHVPALAAELPSRIRQVTPIDYRNPEELEGERVLVVGASASGAQIADELVRRGRQVTLAVGDHVRLPRTYRGMDIHWWMDVLGLLDERHHEVDDIRRARRLPSLQLVGTPERRTLDLNALHRAGVTLVGRLVGVGGTNLQFSGSFANFCTSADLKLGRLLDSIDRYASDHHLEGEIGAPDRPEPTYVPPPATALPLTAIDTVVWATGFRPRYPWLPAEVLDERGAIVHDGGVLPHPGMYVLGLPFTRRRKSSFLDGVGPDAIELTDHLARHLDAVAAPSR